MYSNIFQLTSSPQEEWMSIDEFLDIENGYITSVSDCVREIYNRQEAIDDLINFLAQYGIVYNKNEESIIFQEGFSIRYFKKRYETFKKYAAEISLETFANDSVSILNMENLIEESFGDYILGDNNSLQTFDDFVRDLQGKEHKYYLGSIFSYHY
jgi:hypothetical protein